MAPKEKEDAKPASSINIRVNAPQTEAPNNFVAEQAGEVTVSPFVSRILFTKGRAQNSGIFQPIVSVSLPTPALLSLATTILNILTTDQTVQSFGPAYEGMMTSINRLHEQRRRQESAKK